ncbi:MAG: hypothetical protein SFV32_08060 [Opitutaceae bacterium]|nr:hypothetical protein [Opitutaceae bacterium]
MRATLPLLFLLAGLLFSSCASYDVRREQNAAQLKGRQKVWVKTNFDDNRAMSIRIVEAFRSNGFTVDSGPLTMMPPGFQAVVEYRDAWAWDFREHLVGLDLRLLDPKTSALLATARFADPVSLLSDPSEVANRLVLELYAEKKK